MNFRKNNVLIIGGGIALVLTVLAIVFLVINQGAYRENARALNSARNRLAALNNRNPFPSAENTDLARQNLGLLKAKYEALETSLIEEQITPERIEPARFAPMLEEATVRLWNRAKEGKVALPVEPGLGFKDYAAGKLPPNDPAVLERLVVQIKALEDLVGVAIDARVGSVDSIQRDVFENRTTPEATEEPVVVRGRGRSGMNKQQGAAAGSDVLAPGIPMPAENPQYSVERFVIQVTGRENSIWDILNRLVSRKIIYSIADVSIENTKTSLGKPVDMKTKLAALEAAAKNANRTGPVELDIPREERIVGGREPIRARIVVDMFRFINGGEGEGAP